MILLDTDVMIDLLRQYPPAMQWLDTLDDEEEIALPGFVVMELVQGCRSKQEQQRLLQVLDPYAVVWLSPFEVNYKHLNTGGGLSGCILVATEYGLHWRWGC